VVSENPSKVMDFFTRLPEVSSVLARGKTKSSVALKQGLNSDLRVLEEKSYGAGLMYFTGSKEHNIALRRIAIKRGYKLSEYGLFAVKTGKFVAGKTEKEIYKKLGMDYIEPELRENTGEIEAAQKRGLPKIIPYNSIKGDFHMHTSWTDGQYSTEDMLKQAIKMSYDYIAITDHSKSTTIASGLNEKKLLKHLKEIETLDKKYPEIKILKGAEVDIRPDGSLDYSDKMLKQLDVVVAAVHSRFKTKKDEMTKRFLKAIENPHVTLLAHPTGRLINQRNPYELDFEKILEAAKSNGVFLEINAHPSRLDLNDAHIKLAIEQGVKLAIGTDSHSTDHLRFMEFGVAQARRGWAEAKNIINTFSLKRLEGVLKK
jgi:DNA polymerase (family 10)